jgi:hypothetical protein
MLSVVILRVVMLGGAVPSVFILGVVMLGVILPNVMAPLIQLR